LREIDTAILAADSVESTVGAALSHIRDLIDCRRANLTLIDWGANELVIFEVRTVAETSIPKGSRLPLAVFNDIIQTLSQNQPILFSDLRALADPSLAIQSLLKEGLRSTCSLPLFSQGNLIGMFSMHSELPGFFDEEKINLGQEVANQVAIAITQDNLLKELRELNTELELKVEERTAALAEANALLEALMEYTPDQIYFKDTQGRFIRNSRSQAELLGLRESSEAVGKTDFDFFPHAERSYAEEQEIIRTGKSLIDLEEWVVWPDGKETWVSTTKVPLRNTEGENIGIFGISRDITERKRTEQAIRRLNDDLAWQSIQLQAANKELEAFTYSVSHDLRAPLRAVHGFGQALLNKHAASLGDQGKHYLSRIQDNTSRMGQLIDDLLSLARLSRREMKQDVVNLTELAREIGSELRAQEPGREVNFEVENGLEERGDAGLIRIVLQNLLGNAWKFSSTRQQAYIHFGITTPSLSGRDAEGEVRIYCIRDNGVGFDMTYANKLFGAFQRLHSEAEFPGTGIGLATVQRIIHRHGGRVWAEAQPERGATFYFTLGGNHEP
jgi:PAS domain S-box-containing protein